jgi:hypothetical protein
MLKLIRSDPTRVESIQMSHLRENVLVVMLAGRKGAGKDEAAQYILRKYAHLHPIKLAYADCLKDVAFDLIQSFYGTDLPIIRSDFDDPVKKEAPIPGYTFHGQPLTIRRVLQVVGTDILRHHLGANIWLHSVYQKIRHAAKYTDLIIISDCRFENEITEMESLLQQVSMNQSSDPRYKILSLRINRPRESHESTDSHASEVQDFPVDFTLNNDGSLEQFYQRLDTFNFDINKN